MGNCLKVTKAGDSQYSTHDEPNPLSYKLKNPFINCELACGNNNSHEVQGAGDNIKEKGSHVICDLTSDANYIHSTSHKDGRDLRHRNVVNYNKSHQLSNDIQEIDKNGLIWLNYPLSLKPDGDVYYDCETSSSFAETWDPILFDNPPDHQISRKDKSRHNYFHIRKASTNSRNHKHFSEDNSLKNNDLETFEQSYWPLISTSILGFTVLRSDIPDIVEWLRNGELENHKAHLNRFLIKWEQKSESNTNADEIGDNTLKSGFTSIHNGWLRYTIFIYQEKSDSIKFLTIYRKMKHIFLSLEVRTGCEIRLSRNLFLYKGKLVRTIVIDGPSRKQILRCYSSLPELLTRLMILECERPSMTEPVTSYQFKENGK
ncbi:unnamed protein product [Heterobilharzia americana]|nr:unnamed protein product [Heterobilharzia americana]CAH8434572.1 unnamed protein product [Heterobilharzia americana]